MTFDEVFDFTGGVYRSFYKNNDVRFTGVWHGTAWKAGAYLRATSGLFIGSDSVF